MLKHFLITMYSLQLFFLLENYIKIASRFIRKGKLREEVLMGCSNQVKEKNEKREEKRKGRREEKMSQFHQLLRYCPYIAI